MKISKYIVSIVVGSIIAISVIGANVSASSNNCEVVGSGLNWGSYFTVKGSTTTAKFTVTGEDCVLPVTLVVFKSPSAGGHPLNEQTVFNYTTKTFGPGDHSLTANIPDCYYQADLLEGSSPTAPDGTPNFDYQNGKIIDGGLRDFALGGNKKCTDKSTPDPSTPQVQSTVTTLPNTGPGLGSILGLGSAVSVVGYALHSQWQKRFSRS